MAKDYRREDVRKAGDDVAAGAVANATRFLKDVRYPASKDDLLNAARRNGADPSAIDELRYLPDGARFDDPSDVFRALGDEVEHAHEAAEEHRRS